MRRPRTAILTAAFAALWLVATGCGDDSDDASTTTAAPADGESLPSTALLFETDDGAIRVEIDGSTCTSTSASDFTASGEDDGTTLTASAQAMSGSVVLSGATEFEGRIDSAEVGETGTLRAFGVGSVADDSATPVEFTLTGQCG
jgi:hypothetical protein